MADLPEHAQVLISWDLDSIWREVRREAAYVEWIEHVMVDFPATPRLRLAVCNELSCSNLR